MKPCRIAMATLALCLATGSVPARPAAPGPDTGGDHPPLQVGREAPDFTLPGADGSSSTLTDLRGKKNLVLVFFRGSW